MPIAIDRTRVDVTIVLSNEDGDLVVTIGRDDVFMANAVEIRRAITKAVDETAIQWTTMVVTRPAGCRVEKVILTAGLAYKVSDTNRFRLASAVLMCLREAGCDLNVSC